MRRALLAGLLRLAGAAAAGAAAVPESLQKARDEHLVEPDRLCRMKGGVCDVLLVHVGKACGGSIKYWFRDNDVSYDEVHLVQLAPAVLAHYARVVVTARDPVERLVSAFNWRNPSEQFGKDLWYGGDERRLYDCFRDVRAFAAAVIEQGDLKEGRDCRLLARAFLTDAAYSHTSHLGKGLAYYLGSALADLLGAPGREVWVARSEACDVDAEGAIRWLRGEATNDAPHHAHDAASRITANSTGDNVTEAQSLALRSVYPLTTEYQFLDVLLQRSRNYGPGGEPLAPHAMRKECPRVYIYDLPELWNYHVPLNSLVDVHPDVIFGGPCENGIDHEYHTDQFRLAMILLWRLVRGKRCAQRTLNPETADLFFVPTYPASKGTGEYGKACVSGANNAHLLDKLVHLDVTNAHRHFFVVSKGHRALNGQCDKWWRHPVGLLRRAMRFSYSPHYRGGPVPEADAEAGAELPFTCMGRGCRFCLTRKTSGEEVCKKPGTWGGERESCLRKPAEPDSGIASTEWCGGWPATPANGLLDALRPAAGLLGAQRRAVSSNTFRVPAHKSVLKTIYGPQDLDDDGLARNVTIDPATDPGTSFPHMVSVPYPSSIHASLKTLGQRFPWTMKAEGRHRELLAIYVGKTHGVAYGHVRARLAAECNASAACLVVEHPASYIHKDTAAPGEQNGFCGLANVSYPARFCLEPGGDSPYRKGFYDAMLTGCIPVIFSRAAAPRPGARRGRFP